MTEYPTLDEVLSAEIKQDIAQRFFSFRKLIEEDKLDLDEKVRQYSFILEKRISFELIRIYVLLREERLILAFLELAGLREELFYDPYLAESENIARRVLSCQQFRGWTRAARFRNFIDDCYEKLTSRPRRIAARSKSWSGSMGLSRKKFGNSIEKTTSAPFSTSSTLWTITRVPGICRAAWRPAWRMVWPVNYRSNRHCPSSSCCLSCHHSNLSVKSGRNCEG